MIPAALYHHTQILFTGIEIGGRAGDELNSSALTIESCNNWLQLRKRSFSMVYHVMHIMNRTKGILKFQK